MLRRCGSSFVRRALVAGGAAALVGTCHRGFASALDAPKDAALGELWATAVDGMIDVPGCETLASPNGVLYMAPTPTSSNTPPSPRTWPKIFARSVVFSLTASNPMGMEAPPDWNSAANAALEKAILDIPNTRAPRTWWRSFGFNADEGWREDGFSVAYAREERAFARNAMLKMAHQFRQAAIYAYYVEEGRLVREIVWVDKAKREAHSSKEYMSMLEQPPTTPLAARSWCPPVIERSPKAPPFDPDGRPTSIWDLRVS